MIRTPKTAAEFEKIRPKFEAWLLSNGSSIYSTTNQYEVLRFLTSKGVGVIYARANGTITGKSWTTGTFEAFDCFVKGEPWRAMPRATRRSAKRRVLFNSLIKRDGNRCCYCPVVLTFETATIEHMLNITHGGPSHLANFSLSCQPCNARVGHLSVREKLEFAVHNRRDAPTQAVQQNLNLPLGV